MCYSDNLDAVIDGIERGRDLGGDYDEEKYDFPGAAGFKRALQVSNFQRRISAKRFARESSNPNVCYAFAR